MPKYYNKVPFIKKTDAQWSSLNPILLDGEVILVTTEDDNIRLKVGDGATRYSDLQFLSSNNSGVRMKVGDGATRYSTLRFVSFGDESDDSGISSEQYQKILQMLEEANVRIDSNIEISNENSQLISNIDTEVDELKSNVNTLSEKVTISTSEIAKAIVKVNEATGKIDEVVEGMDEIHSNINELQTSIDTTNTNVETIKTSVNDNLSQIQGLVEEISEVRSEIDVVEENINSTNENLTSLSETVSTHSSQIDSINKNYDILNEQISIVSEISEANTESIGELRDKVNSIINSSTPDGGEGGVSINLAEVIDIRNGYDGTIYETAGDAVRAIGKKVEELSMSAVSPDDLGLMRDETTGMVHPTYKGIPSSQGLFISGGGASGPVFIVRNAVEAGLNFSTSYGDPCFVKYTFSSLDAMTSLPTGNGTAYYYVNSNLVDTKSIPQGENTFDCSKYLKEGINEVSVTVKNADGDTKSLTWEINCISIRLTSTFDYTMAYENGTVTFRYTAFGDAEKHIHFILDGVKDAEVPVISSSGKQNTKIFSNLSHGLHTLEVYAIANINNTEIKSNVLKYDIIVLAEGSVEPIISINCNTTSLLQGELLSIPYIVYDPLATESTVSLDIHVLEDGEYKLYKTETRTVGRSIQYWNTRHYPLGNVKFTIKLRELSRSIDVEVEEYSLPISPSTNAIDLYLSSANRSNTELNPAIWEYTKTDGTVISTDFNNVNWSTSGWIADENGDSTLHLTGGSTAVIKYQPFGTDIRVLGKSLEFEFAVRDVNNRDANVISCMSDGIGINITADKAVLNSSLSSVDCHFNDERRIRVTFTVESRKEYKMMSVYLDGVLTSCKQYVDNDDFQQINPVDITIGSPYCTVDLYTVRAYNIALTQNEVVTNYICDIADIATKAEVYDRNNLYDTSMNLEYAKVKKKIPVMTITGPLPQAKGDKKNVTITYEDPFDETMNFTNMSSTIDVQGTSSAGYVRKNYKIKLAEKYAHVKGGIPTKTYCMKADYAEATSTHNTQIANIAHTLYDDKTPAQEDDARCRTTIQGFPCVIYHKENINSNPYFLGKLYLPK